GTTSSHPPVTRTPGHDPEGHPQASSVARKVSISPARPTGSSMGPKWLSSSWATSRPRGSAAATGAAIPAGESSLIAPRTTATGHATEPSRSYAVQVDDVV